MHKDRSDLTLRIKKLLVAIMAVLLVLSLMTTISYDAFYTVYAEGEEAAQTEAPAETPAEAPADPAAQGAPADGTVPAEGAVPAEGEAVPAEGEQAAGGAEGTAEGAQAIEELLIEDEDQPDIDYGKSGATLPEITSSSFIVMSGSTSEIIAEQHSQRKMSPGKITMLMTAMVAIDSMYNEDELKNTVEITDKIAEYGATFAVGESVTVGDLLKAMLIGGDDESAEALARYSASKRKIFINMMNAKAMELGLLDTQFANPTGAYSTKQYSTAADCAVITQAAVRYQLIKDILELNSAELTASTKDASRVVGVRSTNPLKTTIKPSEMYKFTRGGISGTMTEPSKATQYAGVATVDDMQLIAILMDSKADKIAYEAKGLFQYGDSKVTRNIIVKANKKVGSVRVRYGAQTKVPAYTETKGFAYVPPEGSNDLIRTEVVMKTDLVAPLKDGDKVGEYRIYVADELKGTVDLVISRDVRRGWFPSKYYISNRLTIVIGVVLGIILLFLLRILYVKKRRERLRALRRQHRLMEIAQEQMEIDEDRRRRNWTYTNTYDKVAPRTTDLRKEAIEEELSQKDPKKKKFSRRKAAKGKTTVTDKPREE